MAGVRDLLPPRGVREGRRHDRGRDDGCGAAHPQLAHEQAHRAVHDRRRHGVVPRRHEAADALVQSR